MPELSSPKHSFGHSHYARTRDGRKLHYMIQGEGPCTVVFESGMGFSRSNWGNVQPQVAIFTRAVVYDRAGSGRSDVDEQPRTLARMADDLLDLLDALDSGPYLLVGHSWGGPIIRTAAAKSRQPLKGLVLVDPSDERADLYFSRLARANFALARILSPLFAATGLYKRMGSQAGRVQPPDVYADHLREDFTRRAASNAVAEMKPFQSELLSLRNQPPLPNILPITWISGTLPARGESKIRPAIVAAHQQSAAAHPHSKWVAAPQSSHLVMYSEPEIIIQEIAAMIGSESQ